MSNGKTAILVRKPEEIDNFRKILAKIFRHEENQQKKLEKRKYKYSRQITLF